MSRAAARSEEPSLVLSRCTACGLEADARFTVVEGWSWWSDGNGRLEPYCPACAEREFSHRVSLMPVDG